MNRLIDDGIQRETALADFHDVARHRAQELRREAIGDFWRGADAAWAAVLNSAQRSAQRLGYRLARHARRRGVDDAVPCGCNDRG